MASDTRTFARETFISPAERAERGSPSPPILSTLFDFPSTTSHFRPATQFPTTPYLESEFGWRSHRLPVHRVTSSASNLRPQRNDRQVDDERAPSAVVLANSRQGFVAISCRCGLSTALAVLDYRAARDIPRMFDVLFDMQAGPE